MHSLSSALRWCIRALSVFGLASALVVAFAGPAMAAETASSDLVIIREDVVISDDLYASGVRIIIQGKVDGDLIALAAEDVLIEGEVTGSVFVLASELTVSGVVGGSIRAGVRRLEITGTVGKDVVGAGLRYELGESATVENDVLLWAVNGASRASVGGDLSSTASSIELEGSVDGDVALAVSRLSVTGPLDVSGDLGYRSENEATGLEQATIGGVIAHQTPLPLNVRVRALGLLAKLLAIIGMTAAALLVAWSSPRRTEAAADVAAGRPIRAYSIGLGVMLSPALLAFAAGLVVALVPPEFSLPLLAIFAPLVLALIGIVFVLSLVAGVPAVLAIGRRFPRGFGLFGSVLVGAGLVGVIWLIPLVGWFIPIVVLPLGMGAWILGLRERISDVARA